MRTIMTAHIVTIHLLLIELVEGGISLKMASQDSTQINVRSGKR